MASRTIISASGGRTGRNVPPMMTGRRSVGATVAATNVAFLWQTI
jgi:hypothetical protein